MRSKIYLVLIFFSFSFNSCSDDYYPKPKAYVRFDLPEKNYLTFDMNYPFTFNYPVYALVNKDSSPNSEPYWLNIVFPAQNGKVYFSYKKIKDNLSSLIEDSRTFAYKHTIKADAIKERVFQNEEDNVYGIMYEIEGNTASAVQFFVTDSVRHFIRGSLYFDAHPNKDSLAPLVSFIKEDVLVLMESIKWNNK